MVELKESFKPNNFKVTFYNKSGDRFSEVLYNNCSKVEFKTNSIVLSFYRTREVFNELRELATDFTVIYFCLSCYTGSRELFPNFNKFEATLDNSLISVSMVNRTNGSLRAYYELSIPFDRICLQS